MEISAATCAVTSSTASATPGDNRTPGSKRSHFDEVSDEAPGQTAEAARQFDGLRDPERMAGAGRKPNRERAVRQIETVDPARFTERRQRIDHNDSGDALPIFDQREGIAAAFEDFDRDPSAELSRDHEPEAVVAAVRIADPDDKHQRPFTAAHARCSCSFRKCAAQEMHGS
jgi:hypothetical protein